MYFLHLSTMPFLCACNNFFKRIFRFSVQFPYPSSPMRRQSTSERSVSRWIP
ncbi:hypothetical protein GK3290 [Geobacillus kaustophilus HTA426]|uniref:Uncharacterized protein n=1 Tax=Geobacillus kaustophilus (strain HTA426) TaxID=235909 RepID=Q5KUR1_GEOKA|nr:hypothetical protein GK3290 [Geobacillus kaustophilus HTA426]